MIALDNYSLVTIYSAMAIYTLAFVLFTVDLAKRSSSKLLPAGGLPDERPGSHDGAIRTQPLLAVPKSAWNPRFGRTGLALLVLGWVLHAAGVVLRGLAQGFVPWASMFEFALTSSAVAVAVYLVALRWLDLRFLGVYLTGFVLVTLGVGTVNFYVPVKPLPPALDSYWLVIHVFVASLATALFALGAGLALSQLLQTRREAGRASFALLRTLPDSNRLENMSYLVNVIGFVFWTFTLIAGSIWAERSWGRYWGWDTKEVWTFIIWVVYAGYIHARATRGWTGARSAWLAIIGFSAVIFNFTAVNLFFKGLHAYSGL